MLVGTNVILIVFFLRRMFVVVLWGVSWDGVGMCIIVGFCS